MRDQALEDITEAHYEQLLQAEMFYQKALTGQARYLTHYYQGSALVLCVGASVITVLLPLVIVLLDRDIPSTSAVKVLFGTIAGLLISLGLAAFMIRQFTAYINKRYKSKR